MGEKKNAAGTPTMITGLITAATPLPCATCTAAPPSAHIAVPVPSINGLWVKNARTTNAAPAVSTRTVCSA